MSFQIITQKRVLKPILIKTKQKHLVYVVLIKQGTVSDYIIHLKDSNIVLLLSPGNKSNCCQLCNKSCHNISK